MFLFYEWKTYVICHAFFKYWLWTKWTCSVQCSLDYESMTLKNICYLDHNSSLKDPFDYVQKKTIKMRNRIDMNKKNTKQ